MKVILLKDVPGTGKKFDVKDVSDGFGRNFLLRKGLAELAVGRSLQRIEGLKKEALEKRAAEEAEIAKKVSKLSGIKVVYKGKANEDGNLFAGVKAEDVIKLIKEQADIELSADYINLDKPIKTLGEHAIKIEVGGSKAELSLVAEKE